nr:MAG TPA: hypothetical protein [Caudoviricetes sp.]
MLSYKLFILHLLRFHISSDYIFTLNVYPALVGMLLF